VLPKYPEIKSALRDLKALSGRGRIPISIDLADLRGYHYHSGVVFAAYAPGIANAVALGGRYDEVGKAFGRARPASGFSMDLRDLARAGPRKTRAAGVRAPYSTDPALEAVVRKLRVGGEVVVVALPGHADARVQSDCDRELVKRQGKWIVRKLKPAR
jgi:ATP phosphoribosyltransferase regulatory subunit